jgi:hypothetical protein
MGRTWYHYRKESRLREDAEAKLIRPRTRFIFLHNGSKDLPDKAHDNALWGLHSSELGRAEVLREQAAGGERLCLLKIESPPEHDLYVADTSVFKTLRTRPDPSKDFANAAYDAYWKSLIPFDEYEEGHYAEPEVVCFTPVPFPNAELVEIIEDYVNPRATFNFEELARMIPEPD